MKKIVFVFLIVIIGCFLSGCFVEDALYYEDNDYNYNDNHNAREESVYAVNPLTEEEVKTYVANKILEETGDQVTVTITEKSALKAGTTPVSFGGSAKTVKGGYSYQLKITSKENKEIVGTGAYQDGYSFSSPGVNTIEPYFYQDYTESKARYYLKDKIKKAVSTEFSEYYLFFAGEAKEELSLYATNDTYLYICSTDYQKVNRLLKELRTVMQSVSETSYSDLNVYIYRDASVFHKTNFQEQFTKTANGRNNIKDAFSSLTKVETQSDHFDKSLFENSKIDEMDIADYIVFLYQFQYGGKEEFQVIKVVE